ncbi:AraC family transcriptional regulator [Rathayibacter sp. KR2-224]|uniref:helix-turn-helix transcriptional regulator n=1 Tax=Rathayibacter sp. KR2-224 TaxID=3400913 RepID=UPI003BFF5D0F
MTITATSSPATLDELLSTLEWQVEVSHRMTLAVGVTLASRGATFGYVAAGSARVSSSGPQAVSLTIGAGDVVFTPGRHTVELRGLEPGEIIVTRLRAAGPTRGLELLPELIGVNRLAELDPAIDLLASRMGRLSPTDRHRAGDSVICGRMATTIIAVAIRAWAEGDCAPAGWLEPVEDPFVARVLDAIHEDPGHQWTVGRLAAVAAMSRTIFAERFRTQVGQSPASYLTQVRMDAAMSYLSKDGLTVSETARMLGYDSDAGFSRAFRRHTGWAPSAWRQKAAHNAPFAISAQR